ncbi:MAG: hypothetical protein ABJL67_13435, partial [Sulfitobacter sp.]
ARAAKRSRDFGDKPGRAEKRGKRQMTQAQEKTDTKDETSRDRVRRLFIHPLQGDGMRFKAGTAEADQRKRMDQMADDLGYMADGPLRNLMVCMRTKGEGSKGIFWPSRVSILKFANTAQPRAIEDIPGFKSWFAGAAGRAAQKVPGQLVAEYTFWCRNFHPPFDATHKHSIAMRAGELAQRAKHLNDRRAQGVALAVEDDAWLRRYNGRETMLRSWIERNGGDA